MKMVPKKSQFSPKVPNFAFVELFRGRSQIPNPVLERLTVAISLNFLTCALSMWDTQVDSDSLSEILILWNRNMDSHVSLKCPFSPQTAAGSLTLLYKDSLEELRKAAEINRKLVCRLWWRFKISWVAMSRLIYIIPRDEEWLCFLSMPWFNPDCQYIRRATREPELTLQHGRRANGDLFEERSFWLSWPRTHLDRWWFYTVLDICGVAFSPVPISTTS